MMQNFTIDPVKYSFLSAVEGGGEIIIVFDEGKGLMIVFLQT